MNFFILEAENLIFYHKFPRGLLDRIIALDVKNTSIMFPKVGKFLSQEFVLQKYAHVTSFTVYTRLPDSLFDHDSFIFSHRENKVLLLVWTVISETAKGHSRTGLFLTFTRESRRRENKLNWIYDKSPGMYNTTDLNYVQSVQERVFNNL